MSWSPWSEALNYPEILIHECVLAEGDGWWCPESDVILLEARLDPITRRCVLAHELGHALLGHSGCEQFPGFEWFAARVELAADDWAAERLISFRDLREAYQFYRGELAAIAEQLEVTAEVLSHRLARLGPDQRAALALTMAGVPSG